MVKRIIRPVRDRIFFGCEGDGEVNFVKWLSSVCEQTERALSFDSRPLDGGNPDKMLKKALGHHKRGLANGAYSHAILLIDADRLEGEEENFRRHVGKTGMTLILQRPKLEGVLLRLHAGHERHFPPPEDTNRQLLRVWPEVWGGNHRRAVDADTLGRRFALADLRRAAACDEELRRLLALLGLPP